MESLNSTLKGEKQMDENEIQELLDEAIKTELQTLTSASNDEARTKVISRVQSLHKLRIEELKTLSETEDRQLRRNMDTDARDYDERAKRRQERGEELDRWLRLAMGVAELALPLAFYGAWMKMGFEFEENGAITSGTFKNLIKFFKPNKKS